MVGAGYLSARSRGTPQAFAFPQEQLDVGQRTSNRFDRAYVKVAYATGGFAYGGVTAHTLAAQAATSDVLPLQSSNAIGHIYNVRFGWTVGGGIEWMFAPNTSLKAEYLFYDLGELSYGSSPLTINSALAPLLGVGPNVVAPVSHTRFSGQLARFGINYHFDLSQPDSVVATK